jgi:hypothetical protein
LSIVVFGGTVGAVLGSLLAGPAGALVRRRGVDELAGPYLASAVLLFLVSGLLLLWLRPEPRELAAAIERGDLVGLGRAFDDNQALLEALGVSSDEVEALVATARRAGALGAKLTGGGAGGAVIALAERPDDVAARLRRSGATTLVVRVD